MDLDMKLQVEMEFFFTFSGIDGRAWSPGQGQMKGFGVIGM